MSFLWHKESISADNFIIKDLEFRNYVEYASKITNEINISRARRFDDRPYITQRLCINGQRNGRQILMAKIFVIDIDGTLCEDISNEHAGKMADAKEIQGARDWVNSRYGEGNYICLFTARTKDLELVTKDWLERHGIQYHSIIFGKPRKLGYEGYHFIDNSHVQATTFKEEFSSFKKVQHEIEVFS